MKLTPENINDLKQGDNVWLSEKSFSIPTRLTYVGDMRRYKVLAQNYGTPIWINTERPNLNGHLVVGNIFTTYEEACERMREQSLETIEYYNKHQFKNNPIKVIE